MAKLWKKGRGKLGIFDPLLGEWVAEAETPMGSIRCTRQLSRVLGGNYVQLVARWHFGDPGSSKVYEEHALIGVNAAGDVAFWSFTSDGKHSEGKLEDVTDLHPEAVGFEAQMPAGLARMAYWPEDGGGFAWVVESRNKQGWKRFVIHHYAKSST